MDWRAKTGLGCVVFLCGVSAAGQTQSGPQLRLTSAEIAQLPTIEPGAGTSGISSIKMSVLYGDPNKSGPYTIALEVPPNTRIKAHTHEDERTTVVVRGTWDFGYGPKANEQAFKALNAGSFYSEPAGVPHFAKTGTDGATVYISGWGPTDTVYTE